MRAEVGEQVVAREGLLPVPAPDGLIDQSVAGPPRTPPCKPNLGSSPFGSDENNQAGVPLNDLAMDTAALVAPSGSPRNGAKDIPVPVGGNFREDTVSAEFLAAPPVSSPKSCNTPSLGSVSMPTEPIRASLALMGSIRKIRAVSTLPPCDVEDSRRGQKVTSGRNQVTVRKSAPTIVVRSKERWVTPRSAATSIGDTVTPGTGISLRGNWFSFCHLTANHCSYILEL